MKWEEWVDDRLGEEWVDDRLFFCLFLPSSCMDMDGPARHVVFVVNECFNECFTLILMHHFVSLPLKN
jgi:hypothetical protein